MENYGKLWITKNLINHEIIIKMFEEVYWIKKPKYLLTRETRMFNEKVLLFSPKTISFDLWPSVIVTTTIKRISESTDMQFSHTVCSLSALILEI